MRLKHYVLIWFIISCLLAHESYSLNFDTTQSLLTSLQKDGTLPASLNLDPATGKPLSVCLGWIGFSLMVILNVYSLRKRFGPMKTVGRSARWLEFHIFCGLMGPVFILFHTGFKVGGLVAISFWCMVVVGRIVGRYFYLQVVRQKSELEREIRASEEALARLESDKDGGITADRMQDLKRKALKLAGVGAMPGALNLILSSILGDLHLRWGLARMSGELDLVVRDELQTYAISSRRRRHLERFRSLMGHWHSFHAPFAVILYIVASIHVVTALVFRVAE